MAEETDGVGETFDDSLRVALTIASQFGERIARMREQLARQREAEATQEARELSARFDAERGAARAALAPVQQPGWWDQAEPQDIADAHETATAWRDFDAVAKDAGDTIKQEVQQRYGIDVDAPGANPPAVAAALAQAERDRAYAAAERSTSGEELTAAQLLFAQADRHEREAQERAVKDQERDASEDNPAPFGVLDPSAADPQAVSADEHAQGAARERGSQLYDSSERRQKFASSLEGKGISQDAIAARMLADSDNAKHPREAVSPAVGKATKIRNKGNSLARQRDRGALSR
jgi:colicin import membrane protein